MVRSLTIFPCVLKFAFHPVSLLYILITNKALKTNFIPLTNKSQFLNVIILQEVTSAQTSSINN